MKKINNLAVFMATFIIATSAAGAVQAKSNWEDYFTRDEAKSIKDMVKKSIRNEFRDPGDEWSKLISSKLIKDDAITTDKVSNGAVTTPKLADGSVTAAKFAAGAVVSASIADGSITSSKLASGSVTSTIIANGTIENGDIKDGAVTAAKLGTGTVVRTVVTGSAPDSGAEADNTMVDIDDDSVYYTKVAVPQLIFSKNPTVNVYAEIVDWDDLSELSENLLWRDVTAIFENGYVWIPYAHLYTGVGEVYTPDIIDYKIVVTYER